jgi:hypothetical protein
VTLIIVFNDFSFMKSDVKWSGATIFVVISAVAFHKSRRQK